MTVRIVGAVLIIIGCGGVGLLIASAHRNQTNILRQFIFVLDYLQCELQYHQSPLPDLCRLAAQNTGGVLKIVFLSLSDELDKQISPDVPRCMAAALEKTEKLQVKTKDAFILLGQSLGCFDIDGQLKGLEMTKCEVSRMLMEHTSNQDNRIRCYQTLSICAGAAIAILLI